MEEHFSNLDVLNDQPNLHRIQGYSNKEAPEKLRLNPCLIKIKTLWLF